MADNANIFGDANDGVDWLEVVGVALLLVGDGGGFPLVLLESVESASVNPNFLAGAGGGVFAIATGEAAMGLATVQSERRVTTSFCVS